MPAWRASVAIPPIPTMDVARVPLAAAWLAAFALVTWSNRWDTPDGEKRWPMPFTELQITLPSSDPVEATAPRAERVCTGEPREMPMRPNGAVPDGDCEPCSWWIRPLTGVTVRVLSTPLRSTT